MSTKKEPGDLQITRPSSSPTFQMETPVNHNPQSDTQTAKAPKPRLKHYILTEDAGVCRTYCGQQKPSAWKVGAGTGRPVAQRVLCPDCENLHQLHADMEDSIGTGSQKLLTLLDALDRLEELR